MQSSQRAYETCFIIYKYFGGRNVARIEREMRGLGHESFHRRILYSRTERGVRKPGWIERFGWEKIFTAETPRRGVNTATRSQEGGLAPAACEFPNNHPLLTAETRRRGVNAATDSQEGGLAPAISGAQNSGGKPAFLTATGRDDLARAAERHKSKETKPQRLGVSAVKNADSFHSWLKRVSPMMTWDWRHQLHIINQLEKVTSGECKRLMIFLPPRHGKSELVTVRYSAWRMQRDPSLNMILGSYNQRLADRFSRKVRRVLIDAHSTAETQRRGVNAVARSQEGGLAPDCPSLQTSGGKPAFPTASGKVEDTAKTEHTENTEQEKTPRLCVSAVEDSPFPFASSRPANSISEWETACGGGFRSVGVGGGVTGFGAGLIVIDDPVKSRAEAESETYREKLFDWFNDDLYTRLEPNGAIILIQTRWHEDDLAGRLLREMHEGGEHWDVIDLPAIAEDQSARFIASSASTAETQRRGINAATLSQEGGFTPAVGMVETSGGKPTFPTASDEVEDTAIIEHTKSTEEKTPRLGVSAVHNTGDPLNRQPGQALCPERFDLNALEKIKQKLGTYSFSALYQQRPTPSEGGIFKREWFKRIIPYAPAGLKWKRGYDIAVSTRTNADYTASFRCAFDDSGNLYIAGGFRSRIEFPEQRRFIIERILAEPDTEHGIELALHGHALIQDLRRVPGIRGHMLRGVKVETDKLTRALAWAPLAEEGKVILVRSEPTASAVGTAPVVRTPTGKPSCPTTTSRPPAHAGGSDSAPWIDNFLDEVCSFPNAPHDDQIDAVSLAVQLLKSRKFGAMGW